MNRIIALSVFMLIVCSSCSYLKNVKLLTGGSLEREDFVQEIPFLYRKGLIVIQAKINNDTTTREFIFDTGAFNSKIEKGLADELGLPTITTKENSTAQGVTQTIEVTRIDSIAFGDTKFYNIGAGKLTYSEGSSSPCIAKNGLIGSNLIKLAHWKIDYKNQKMYFSDKPFVPENDKSETIRFNRPVLSSTPKIDLQVAGKEAKGLMFDTGYNGGLVMPSSLASSFPNASERILIDRSTTGIYGSNIDTLIEKPLRVTIANNSANIPVAFSSLGKGLLGNDFLEHFTVLINNDEDEITLESNGEVMVEAASAFIPGILNDSTWVVNKIESKVIDLHLGDSIRLINGKRPSDLFVSNCDYFMNIREFLNGDSLIVELTNNRKLKLK